jgi:hypothetical protein
MDHTNRVAKLFGHDAACKACNEQPRPEHADSFAELKRNVAELLQLCRAHNIQGDQLAHTIALAIYKSVSGGRQDGR